MHWYPQMGNMMGYYGGGLGWIFMIFWWALIIFGIVALARFIRGRHGGCCGGHGDHGKSSLDILKERYAKGEISQQEFERIKKEIE